MIAAPVDGDIHLEILSGLVSLLMDSALRERLLQANSPEAFLEELGKAETCLLYTSFAGEKPEGSELKIAPVVSEFRKAVWEVLC